MTVPPVLLSVNVGLPKNVAWQGRTVYTGAWKHPVDGPAMVRRLNIDGDGDGQDDTNGHGEVLICCARPSADIVLDM
jgi:MOSC domain-containing protein YiiM